jgi:HEAT repeat protein
VANLATNAEYKQRIVAEGGLDPMIALTRSRYDKAWFHSCRGLFALAADDGNKLLIVKAGGLRPLVERLSDDAGTHVQWYAAGAVANLAIHPDLKLRIAEEGGLQRLIALAHSDNERVVRQVVRGLFALAAKTEVRHLMVEAGALFPLVRLLGAESVDIQRNAAGAVGNIAMTDVFKKKVVDADALLPLIRLAGSRDINVQRQVARALFTLSAEESVKTLIANTHRGLKRLVSLSAAKSVEIQRDAAGALANIAIGSGHKVKVAKAGGIKALVRLVQSPSPLVQRQAARALFALAGHEANQEMIVDEVHRLFW